MTDTTTIERWTDAPEAYDGFSTRTVLNDAGETGRGLAIRVVRMEERDAVWQEGRYRSGLYVSFDSDFALAFAASGVWKLSASGLNHLEGKD